jgi:hypothetical protein
MAPFKIGVTFSERVKKNFSQSIFEYDLIEKSYLGLSVRGNVHKHVSDSFQNFDLFVQLPGCQTLKS